MEKQRAIKYVGISIIICSILTLLFVMRQAGLIELDCITYKYIGIYCPGCGGTRMLESLLQLDIYQAFRYNPLIAISIPFYVYMYIKCGVEYIKNGKITSRLANYMLAYAIIIMAYSIIRNISWFSILIPTKIN